MGRFKSGEVGRKRGRMVRIGHKKKFKKQFYGETDQYAALRNSTPFSIMRFLLCLVSQFLRHAVGVQEIRHKTTTKKLSLELTVEELEVLLPLASDQLFRNEFIDTRLPGFERNSAKLQSAKAVLNRIKERLHQAQQRSGDNRATKHSVA